MIPLDFHTIYFLIYIFFNMINILFTLPSLSIVIYIQKINLNLLHKHQLFWKNTYQYFKNILAMYARKISRLIFFI